MTREHRQLSVMILVSILSTVGFVLMSQKISAEKTTATSKNRPPISNTTAASPSIPIRAISATTLPPPAPVGLPGRFRIPRLAIDTELEHVGLTATGAVDVPTAISRAAWFSHSQRPGEPGTAIIDGHYGWVNRAPAIFTSLHKLQAGDEIFVTDEFGKIYEFVVRKIRTYRRRDDISTVYRAPDGLSHLNLITCEGIWNQTTESYSGRLVVFSDLQ